MREHVFVSDTGDVSRLESAARRRAGGRR